VYSPDSTFIGNMPLPPRGKVLEGETKAGVSNLISSNQPALRLLYSAQTRSRSRYPINLKQGLGTLLPHLSNEKRAVWLLTAEAMLHAGNDETEKAVESLAAAGHVADSLVEEPVMVSQLVRIACWNIIVLHLEHVINATTLTDDQLASLQKMLDQAEQPQALARGFAGEQANGIFVFTDHETQVERLTPGPMSLHYRHSTTEKIVGVVSISLLKVAGLLKKDEAFYLDVMAMNIAAAERPYPERFKLGQKAAAMTMTPPNRFYIISRMMLPYLFTVWHRDADHAARIQVAQTALAVERFRLAHGKALPADLGELVPSYLNSVPLDPCDGQKLRFKKRERGYIIYSIGRNGRDDGGTELAPKNPAAPHDITFTMER
jgi:hypothetical protein